MVATVAVLLDDTEVAFRAIAPVLDRAPSTGVTLWSALGLVARAVADDAPEDAAVLYGGIDAQSPGFERFLHSQWRGASADIASKGVAMPLDAARVEQLRDRGASMTAGDLCAYASAVIARHFAE